MKRRALLLLRLALTLATCSAVNAEAQGLLIPHPDDSSKNVEYFLEEPEGSGPWPAVIFLHGHQDGPRPGGKDFVTWGVLDRFAKRGYLSVAISQPGYGGSDGPADFCGAYTQRAVSAVIEKMRRDGLASPGKIIIEGISRGALVGGLLAAHDTSIAGVVLIAGLYDLPLFLANSKSDQGKMVAQSIVEETGGGNEALRVRSVLYLAQDFKVPALIMNGAKDDRTDPEQARSLAKEINSHGGKARVIIYPDYGHQIPVRVRESVIDEFIDGVSGK